WESNPEPGRCISVALQYEHSRGYYLRGWNSVSVVSGLGTPLGKPGGSVTITTCATDPTTGEVLCSAESTLNSLTRKSGKQTFTNVTNDLTSIVVSFDGGSTYQRMALFSGGFYDFFWQYANSGLRLLQLRFYLL